MNKIYRLLVVVFAAISLTQCQKDISYTGGPDPIPVINKVDPEPITAQLQGNVLDDNNQPAAGVSIAAGTRTAITDSKGYFRIPNAPLDKKSALVTAEKAGYFKGYRVFAATTGANQVVIKLVKKTLVSAISAATGGTATLANGASVTLPAAGIVAAATNTAYTGNVNIYAAYIDPTASDIAVTVPGSFAATDKNGSRVTLSSYGMLAVVLESDAGEKLQIKDGAVAALTTPIPALVLSSAPATIALWSVDETTGLWKEEGTATRQGSSYVGNVKHFSFWNCDQPLTAVYLSMTLHNVDSLPLVHAMVKVTRGGTGFQTSTYGYTDSLGQVSGLVPANETLTAEVLDPCYNTVYTHTLQPITQNTDLGIITVSSFTALNTLKGIILDCGGLPVKNGYAIITIDNIARYAATDSAGAFITTFITCSSTSGVAQVIGIDGTGQQQSAGTAVTLTQPLTNAGIIVACGTSTAQYLNYTFDGNSYQVTNAPGDSLTAYTINQGSTNFNTYLSGFSATAPYIFIQSAANATGTFPVQRLDIDTYYNVTPLAPFNITFTKFANTAGDFYQGSFSGSFKDTTLVTHTLSGTFKIKRS